MEIKEILRFIQLWLPAVGLLVAAIFSITIFNKIISKTKVVENTSFRWMRQLILLSITVTFFILILLSLPISESMKGQLFNLLGIAIMATITLSSTTFVSNSMSGFMLKVIDGIRPGDFLKVGAHEGRVSEQGLLHIEIQTEDSDLTTLPNLYLVTTPVTVVRSSGTIVSATISLGYDIPRAKIEPLLVLAGERAGLTDPFVQVLELGDYSVTYRAAGFLSDVRYLISFRSELRGHMLDVLHENDIEIVSPTFMNQRVYPSDKCFIPKHQKNENLKENSKQPEDLIFEKADEAESKEKIKEMIEKNKVDIEKLNLEVGKDSQNEELKVKLEKLEKRKDYLIKILERKEKE